jgi:hypothetical protein
MPAFAVYINFHDLDIIMGWLNNDIDISFIVSDGSHKWRAVETIDKWKNRIYCLWHRDSGLPLIRKDKSSIAVPDPWAGWTEEVTGANSHMPYFGPGYPGIYWLYVRCTSTKRPENIGISYFEWIGNYFKKAGCEAPQIAQKWWNHLRGWVKKNAIQIPVEGEWDDRSAKEKVWAFPGALKEIQSGRGREKSFFE